MRQARPLERPALVFMWEQFSAYHVDRLEAVAQSLGGSHTVVGIEVASRSHTYAWEPIDGEHGFARHTLFPDAVAEEIPWHRKLVAALRVIARYEAPTVFLCNQEQPEILLGSLLLRLTGRRPYAMLDAKFDDHPRRVLHEAVKQLAFRVYCGGLVAGQRHQDYYRFLGLPAAWSQTGYDTVSIERVRRQAGVPLAPDGMAFAERPFVVVARFVPKKQIETAIMAYAAYWASSCSVRRKLVLCGSGPCEPTYRRLIAELGVDGVEFPGFLGPEDVALTVANGLCLLLPGVDEQWGLVVNEAVALGIPVLCSTDVGARDALVRVGVNGFVHEPGNYQGLAALMALLSEDEALWRRMSLACARLAPEGDVSRFVTGVAELVRSHAPVLTSHALA